jgi:hypothetical protein
MSIVALDVGRLSDRRQPKLSHLGSPSSPGRTYAQHTAIIALQRAAGNAAVTELLTGYTRHDRFTPSFASARTVQRCGAMPCDCLSAEDKESGTSGTPAEHDQIAGRIPDQETGTPKSLQRQEPEETKTKSSSVAHETVPDDRGCAQGWGQDTSCSKWGVVQSQGCCNSWPLSVEEYARTTLKLDGAASCYDRDRETATVTSRGKPITVLCSDAMWHNNFKPKSIDKDTGDDKTGPCSDPEFDKARENNGGNAAEVIELSGRAHAELGDINQRLPVVVSYSGSKDPLLCSSGTARNHDKIAPNMSDCLPAKCPTPEDPLTFAKPGEIPTRKKIRWRRN